MQTAMIAEKPRKQAILGRFRAGRTYRGRIKDDHKIEPAMGSAAFLNEAINQLAEAYISRKEQETGNIISYENRFNELQKVKMYIADRNVYGIDLNPVAVELAEVSLWLNTIYEGGFVPWFGTQLVNGNSLIGSRRQAYPEMTLQTSSKGLRWFDNVPERVPLGTERKKRRGNTQIYHFLLGDPGMCNYSDKVIKQLEPDNIKKLKAWNKKFIAPYSNDELETLRQLSLTIDELWNNQIKLRQTVDKETQDALSIFGREDAVEGSHTTIRQKDLIYSKLYKSEHMKNAGPYARLKFAMDYWCALWFWPIDQAEMLPTRSEYFNDLNLILVGTIDTGFDGKSAKKSNSARIGYDQLSLFDDENEDLQLIHKINELQGTDKTQVNLDSLCLLFPRLALVKQIAEQNHFMHWELEFADLFAEKGGFDLIIGNPPWIKVTWNEQGVLSDKQPMFAVKKLSATETTKYRNDALQQAGVKELFFSEFESMSGEQSFLNASQNYYDLKGQQTNLFKCFLPQAWMFNSERGVSAFVHPEGVYDDPKGGALREKLYARLRKHFMFANERKLFPEVDHHTTFSLNVYGGPLQTVSFDTICNLYDASSIVECYEGDASQPIPEIKDENGEWNTTGHPDRLLHITKKELTVFAKLFDGSDLWRSARLPVIHTDSLTQAIYRFGAQETTLGMLKGVYVSELWHETNSQKDGTIKRNVHFPESAVDTIYSGPHIGVANPFFKSSRRICKLNSDYDNIDLTSMPITGFQRVNYSPECKTHEYHSRVPKTGKGEETIQHYRVIARKMLNITGERTLICGIVPPGTSHTNGLIGFDFPDLKQMVLSAGMFSSVPFDFFIKVMGKSNLYTDNAGKLPIVSSIYDDEILLRSLMLNCLTNSYAALWNECFAQKYAKFSWAKDDLRLIAEKYIQLQIPWTPEFALRTDYERREALIELDVLSAMALGMTLKQLQTCYRIQFPVLVSYEADTWYDANGRIVFTNNRSLTGVGFSRPEWENSGAVQPAKRGTKPWDGIMKNAPDGYVFTRTIIDDTMPGGPVERTIEYVAPFDRCDREYDYETVWKFFEEKYGKND